MRAEIISRPIALLASSEQIKQYVFSTEYKMLSGQGYSGNDRVSDTVSGGIDVLKFWENRPLRKVALEAEDKAGDQLLLMSVGIKLNYN